MTKKRKGSEGGLKYKVGHSWKNKDGSTTKIVRKSFKQLEDGSFYGCTFLETYCNKAAKGRKS